MAFFSLCDPLLKTLLHDKLAKQAVFKVWGENRVVHLTVYELVILYSLNIRAPFSEMNVPAL